ncbi:sensor histidine kinase [Pedobacter sp.]
MAKNLDKKVLRLHILIWALFITWETIIINILYDMDVAPIIYIVHYIINIALFYFQSDVVLPRLSKNRWRWLWIPLFCIIFLLLYILAHWLGEIFLIHLLKKPIKPWYGMNLQSFLKNGYRALFFIGFSAGYYYLRSYLIQRDHSQRLETERLKAIIEQQNTQRDLDLMQNAFLKAQINPHFLFNILNYIHLQTIKSAPQISEAVTTLANVMRFAFDIENTGDSIRIGDELEQVADISYLYGLKKGQHTLKLNYELAVCDLQLIPLVLLTLAENCYKHGDLSEHDALMSLSLENDQLYISTWNKASNQKPITSTKTGLTNLKKRLATAYGEAHSFTYGLDEESGFNVQIFVRLNQIVKPSENKAADTDIAELP